MKVKKIEEAAKADNDTGNLEASLTTRTLPVQAEAWLIKPPKLHLESSRLLQTISMLLQQTGLLIRLSVRVVKKWREFFLKSYLEKSTTCIRHPSGYWGFFGNNNSKNIKEKY